MTRMKELEAENARLKKLLADLPVAYQYLSGVSKNASDIFRQVLTINAMNQAMHGFAGASGTSSIDSAATWNGWVCTMHWTSGRAR